MQKYQVVAAHAEAYPVRVLCRVLGLARSGFYAWQKRPLSAHAARDQELVRSIQTAFVASRQRYGSPRVHAELHAQGVRCARKRVARLMRQTLLVARQRRRRVCTTDSRHDQPVAPNLLARDFHAVAPDRVWVADITYVPTREGWLYLAVVLDLFARRVVGWATGLTLERALVLRALGNAIARRRPGPGLLHHSDRGAQYASGDYQELLTSRGMLSSMSRKGNCWDNAVMESFFSTLKTELPQAHGVTKDRLFRISRAHVKTLMHQLYCTDAYNCFCTGDHPA
ncbi:MAG: IS3 family transposase, partial [Chloroflexales bacterium]